MIFLLICELIFVLGANRKIFEIAAETQTN